MSSGGGEGDPGTPLDPNVSAPINLSNGNTFIQESDYSIPGMRGGLELVRTWHSEWQYFNPPAQSGMFGNGWTSTYEQRLQPFQQDEIPVRSAPEVGGFELHQKINVAIGASFAPGD